MPILAVGNKCCRPVAGFTLLETLVVLAVLGLMMSIVVPAVGRSMQTSFDDVLNDVQREMRQARSQAIGQQRSVGFKVDIAEHQYQTGTGRWRSIPAGFQLQAQVAKSESGSGVAGIRFYPDGSATGGRIGIESGADLAWLEVDWLTGRISVVRSE